MPLDDTSPVRVNAVTALLGRPQTRAVGIEMIRLWMRTRSVKLLPDARRNRKELAQLKSQMSGIAYGAPLPLLLEGPKA
jgi:hypothetical protein